MCSARPYLRSVYAVFFFGSLLASAGVPAVTVNFSAKLTDGTCTVRLDKSTLSLGTVSPSQLQPDSLVTAQPFTVTVEQCTGLGRGTLRPALTVTGPGGFTGGRYLFRDYSATTSAGVLVIQSASSPDYSMTEVQNNSEISLATPGNVPRDQQLTFYAGVSCGGKDSCASVRPGTLSATLMFSFAYL